jgi:ParB family transcriptional regulator, chromosome partitioning protein
MKEAALGRGLSALIPKRPTAAPAPALKRTPEGEVVEALAVDAIDPNPHQPRQAFDDRALEDLTASIKTHGILQPLIVTKLSSGRFELVAGERRLRAAKRLGWKDVPAIVRTVSRQSKLELALIENIQRKDLSPIEEAEAYRALIDEFGLTQEEVAKRVGKNRATVANTLRLLNLPLEIQASLRDGRITMSHAKVILSAVEPSRQLALWHSILKDKLTVRRGEELGRRMPGRSASRPKGDPELAALEDQLRDVLKTRVQISRRGERGTISIEFYSNDELDSLVNAMTT